MTMTAFALMSAGLFHYPNSLSHAFVDRLWALCARLHHRLQLVIDHQTFVLSIPKNWTFGVFLAEIHFRANQFVNDQTTEAPFASSTVWNSVSYASALPFADTQLPSPSIQPECHPMAFPMFSSPLTPTYVQTPISAVDDTLLRLTNFVNATNSDDTQQQQHHQPFVRQQKVDNSQNGDNCQHGTRSGIVYAESNILTMSKLAMLESVRSQVRSPIVDFLCAVLADVNQFGHVCSFISSREFKIHNTKTFTELLNLRSRQKPKSYLQVARALKSYEDRVVDGYVMLRKLLSSSLRSCRYFISDLLSADGGVCTGVKWISTAEGMVGMEWRERR
uniref:Uncharacterized protein n=1 Tax=Globodera rostochiensis TaxID=31243 RepID=A0A914GYT6_GLORO